MLGSFWQRIAKIIDIAAKIKMISDFLWLGVGEGGSALFGLAVFA